MVSWQLTCTLIIVSVALASGSPLPKKEAVESARRGRVLEADDDISNTPERKGRQGFFDYFSSPYGNYKSQQYPDYSSFHFGNFYDSPSYGSPSYGSPSYGSQSSRPSRPSYNKPARKRYDQRRKQFEGTTQRWTVWDLAKKWSCIVSLSHQDPLPAKPRNTYVTRSTQKPSQQNSCDIYSISHIKTTFERITDECARDLKRYTFRKCKHRPTNI